MDATLVCQTAKDALRASPTVCQILVGKSCILPTYKKI
jgi:hypothetical protein